MKKENDTGLMLGLSTLMLALLLLAIFTNPYASKQTAEQTPTQAVVSTPEPSTAPEPPEETPAAVAQLSSTVQTLEETVPPEPEETVPTEPEETVPTEPEEPGEPVEPVEVQLYTDVNEVVYAIGTVNIRASWSASSEKLGSMGIGESVTRTGVPIPGTEAEGWSRVCLADGSTAYMHSSLLSTTQPVTQPASQPTYQAPATGDAGSGGTGSGGTGAGTQAPSTGGGTASTGNRDGWDQAFYETLNDYQKAQYESLTAAERAHFKAGLEVYRNLEAQGYTSNWCTDPDVVEESWRSISH